ncbi:hypothetical protein LOTGIDRAFT_158396 [Lottia gigantea]|uniref:Ketosynthase family 3 (KS3) domain-containing protein n=1 Tax=Lottia gigantea TaxID=225164 RepID=V4AW42_LOTGI|nr:hypothetical protein LOTGIDRAFT_158396 [Lottia gigantea]ESO99315.1 hypothetical protein LOTGIDRAFT_158396 [Lottia gigantea]
MPCIPKWDYKFYGINEFESLRMDPQHKFILDSTYMALENAGITRKEIKGSNTGVYIGVMNGDYSSNFATSVLDFDNYTITGTNDSIISSRVNYVFDLHGPSMTIDTACSSSLIAIHIAHQAILLGECDMCIAGGVNCLLKPDILIQLSKAGMVSPKGQCQAFSENADGYARGTGTKAWDPVEVKALGTFFQTDENLTPKIIGSVKTNIGHLESAAGVAVDIESLLNIKRTLCENAEDLQLADFSYTSIYTRDHDPCRLAVAGPNTAEVLQILEGTDVDKHVMVKYQPAKGKKYIFVFAGLGTNWQGMCQEMLKRFKVFRSTIEDISKYLERYANWNLMENLQNGFDLEDANIAPIMTFACEEALFVLVESFGINPDAIIGQSIGEVAAAFASGAVTLEQAVYIIYHRTRVQVRGTGGKMFVAKNIEIDKVEEILEKYESQANV